jgi:hypothetical protein
MQKSDVPTVCALLLLGILNFGNPLIIERAELCFIPVELPQLFLQPGQNVIHWST